MLLASWTFDTILKGSRSFNAENLESVGQRAAKILAFKVGGWKKILPIGPPRAKRVRTWPIGRFFFQPPTLKANIFAALWPTDSKFSALKDLDSFKMVSKVEEASSILRMVFSLSKWPHSHRAYLVTLWTFFVTAVSIISFCLSVQELSKTHLCAIGKEILTEINSMPLFSHPFGLRI